MNRGRLLSLFLVCAASLFSAPCCVEAMTSSSEIDLCGRERPSRQDHSATEQCSIEDAPPSASAAGGMSCLVPYLTSRNLIQHEGVGNEVLGEGGFGKVVRKTLCLSLCGTCSNPLSVAQKTFSLKKDYQGNTNAFLGLQREARLMARVTCPNNASLLEHPGRQYVVQTHAVINDGSCTAEYPMSISMKVYDGGDLAAYLDSNNEEAKSCSAKTELALKIAMGLQYIHAVGITHRDLHAGNILLDKDGEPAITALEFR